MIARYIKILSSFCLKDLDTFRGGSAVTDTYSYDAHDKLTGISGGTNKTYGYDSQRASCHKSAVASTRRALRHGKLPDAAKRNAAETYRPGGVAAQ